MKALLKNVNSDKNKVCRHLESIKHLDDIFITFLVDVWFFYFFEVYLFIFERDKDSMSREGQREKERENPKQSLHGQHGAQRGARTHEITRSWPELKSRIGRLTDWATQMPLL